MIRALRGQTLNQELSSLKVGAVLIGSFILIRRIGEC